LRYPQIDSLVSNGFVHKISIQCWFLDRQRVSTGTPDYPGYRVRPGRWVLYT
jgi:hypothetical protein